MFLFITISGNFSPAHKAAPSPGTVENRTKPQPGSPSPPRQGRYSCDPAALTTRCRCRRCASDASVENCERMRLLPMRVPGVHGRGIGSHCYRSPFATSRHGSALVPSGLLVKLVTSSSPGPWKTWRRPRRFLRRYPPSDFGSMAQRANGRAFRSALPAPAFPAPAAQPVSAHLSACGQAYLPGSRADFTPRLFGPLSGAFDCA